MREVKPVFKLENPSVGTRKESILTDEMLVAFCESRLEWLKDDISDLFKEMSEYHESVLNRFEMYISATPEIIASPYEVASLKMPYHFERKDWGKDLIISFQSPNICLDFKKGEPSCYTKADFDISIPFIDPWSEGGRDFDFDSAQVWHLAKCSMSEIDRWIDFKNWIYESVGFFESYIKFCEEEERDYFDMVKRLRARLHRNLEELNLMRWKKELAQKRALQSRALDIIEFGYSGEEQQVFRKRDVPVMVKELEIIRITPSLKTVDVRFKGRDFKKYLYGYHGIWRTGTEFHKEREWVQKGVRVATLLGMDVVEDYSEEACPYDETIKYPA